MAIEILQLRGVTRPLIKNLLGRGNSFLFDMIIGTIRVLSSLFPKYDHKVIYNVVARYLHDKKKKLNICKSFKCHSRGTLALTWLPPRSDDLMAIHLGLHQVRLEQEDKVHWIRSK